MTEHAPHTYAEKLEQLQELRREAAHAEGPAVEKQHAKGINSIVELRFGSGGGDVRFADRYDAGRRLAARLADIRGEDLVVVGIPRGGVAVAAEVARALGAPLDVVVVRKIGAPGKPEYAIGALAEGDVSVISDEAVRGVGLGAVDLELVVGRARRELARRMARYSDDRARLSVAGRTVLLIDDGLATGRSAQAAARSLRQRGAARVILAVPVAAPESVRELRSWVDDVVCVEMPTDLWAIGLWYEDFSPTSDEEVEALLAEHAGTVAREVASEAAPKSSFVESARRSVVSTEQACSAAPMVEDGSGGSLLS